MGTRTLCFALFGAVLFTLSAPAHADEGLTVEKAVAPNKYKSARLFRAASDRFTENFDAKRLRREFKRMAAGDTRVSPKLWQYLYKVRKSGAVLRTGFMLFDSKHSLPPALHEYVRISGKLNDAIKNNNKALIPVMAKRAMKTLDTAGIGSEIKGFSAAPAASVRQQVESRLSFISESASKKKLKAPVFHKMRKEMTHFLHLFEPGVKLGREANALLTLIDTIRLESGDLHDHLVSRKLRGEINYKTKKVKVPKSIRKKVDKAVAALKKNGAGKRTAGQMRAANSRRAQSKRTASAKRRTRTPVRARR